MEKCFAGWIHCTLIRTRHDQTLEGLLGWITSSPRSLTGKSKNCMKLQAALRSEQLHLRLNCFDLNGAESRRCPLTASPDQQLITETLHGSLKTPLFRQENQFRYFCLNPRFEVDTFHIPFPASVREIDSATFITDHSSWIYSTNSRPINFLRTLMLYSG